MSDKFTRLLADDAIKKIKFSCSTTLKHPRG